MDLVGLATALKLIRSIRSGVTEHVLEWKDRTIVPPSIEVIKKTLRDQAVLLSELLPSGFPPSRIGDLTRHLHFAEWHDFRDIMMLDLPDIEEKLEQFVRLGQALPAKVGFEELLHPLIEQSSLTHFRQEHYRIAVLEGVGALFRFLQASSGISDDGDALVARAFKHEEPRIKLVDDVSSDTGKSIQRGILLLCQGSYSRFRNPRAHTRAKEISRKIAAQELITLSRLMDEIENKQQK